MSERPKAHSGAGDDPRIVDTLLIGLVGIVLVALTIVGLEVLYYRTAEQASRILGADGPSAELTEMRAAQQQLLTGYRWVDREQGIVAIPVEQAAEIVVHEQGARRGMEPRR